MLSFSPQIQTPTQSAQECEIGAVFDSLILDLKSGHAHDASDREWVVEEQVLLLALDHLLPSGMLKKALVILDADVCICL